MPVFESRAELKTSAQELFDFLIHPENLQPGSQLDCRVQAYGLVQEMTYEIVEFESPVRFREKMVKGPLQLWLHDYLIEPSSKPGYVTLVNRIEFEPPAGLMGFLVTADKISDALEDGFDYRRDVLEKKFNKPL